MIHYKHIQQFLFTANLMTYLGNINMAEIPSIPQVSVHVLTYLY